MIIAMIAASNAVLALAAAAGGFQLSHEPIACMVKDRHPLVEASIEPAKDVARARVYFRSEAGVDFYYVPMTLVQGRFQARLPKPRDKARSVVYYVQVAGNDGIVQQTAEISAEVVKKRDACAEGAIVAPEGSGGDIPLYTTTDSSRKPGEFGGIETVASQAAVAPDRTAAPPTPTAPVPTQEVLAPPSPQPAPSTAPPQVQPPPMLPGHEDYQYLIGGNDILKISVFGYDDLTQVVLVQPDGTFMYPLIGRVKAADLTAKDLERTLTTMLGKGYLRNPQVTVTVQEARSRSIYVLGEAARAGRYSLVEARTILDLAARAGISNTADVLIVRPRGAVEGPVMPPDATGEAATNPNLAETIRVSMRDIQMGNLSQNLPLHPNDTVFVLAGQRVYVVGEVRSPGAFHPPVGGTVRQMILLAGGFTDRASKGSIRIQREVEGKRKEFKAKPDDEVLPGDVITVKAKLF
jgi:polysaccharide export outer membrane protein